MPALMPYAIGSCCARQQPFVASIPTAMRPMQRLRWGQSSTDSHNTEAYLHGKHHAQQQEREKGRVTAKRRQKPIGERRTETNGDSARRCYSTLRATIFIFVFSWP